jgi:hypothetical protein
MAETSAQTGIQPLTESLNQVQFPISREELLQRYGDTRIQLVHGTVMSLREALADIQQPSFKSLSDLAVAVGENRRVDEVSDW